MNSLYLLFFIIFSSSIKINGMEDHKQNLETTLLLFLKNINNITNTYIQRIKIEQEVKIEQEINEEFYNIEERNKLFNSFLSFFENFFNKKYSNLNNFFYSKEDFEKNNKLEELISDLSNYYKKLLITEIENSPEQKITKENKENILSKLNISNTDANEINNLIPYHNIFIMLNNTKEKNKFESKDFEVIGDNHTSLSYYQFIEKVIDQKNVFFCGDLCGKGQYKYFLDEKLEKINNYNKLEKELFLVDSLNSLAILHSRILAYEINPTTISQVLGNHEQLKMLKEKDLKFFLKTISSNTQSNFICIALLLKLITPTEIIQINKNKDAFILNHSGASIYWPKKYFKEPYCLEKKTTEEIQKIIFYTEKLINQEMYTENNEFYYKNHEYTSNLKNELIEKNIYNSEPIYLWCKFMKNIETKKKQTFENNISYTEKGLEIKEVEKYLNFLNSIYRKMIEEQFEIKINTISSFFGHQHSDKNLLTMTNLTDRKYDTIIKTLSENNFKINFLPPQIVGNSYSFHLKNDLKKKLEKKPEQKN